MDAALKQVIYKIINTTTNDFYVGSTNNQYVRFRTHKKQLKANRHHCKPLQAAWNKYGSSAFVFVVIEAYPDDVDLQQKEDVWLKAHVGEKHCYNTGIRSGAPWRGVEKEKHPNFGKPKTPAAKAAISNSLKAFYAEAPENHPRYGKTLSEESRAKISANRKGKMAGESHYRYGQTVSEEVRKKIGDTQRGVKKGPRKYTAEGLAKITAAAKRGAESHFYGKRPANADALQKAIYCSGNDKTYPSITAARVELGILPTTIHRALKSGEPLKKGQFAGWSFRYL